MPKVSAGARSAAAAAATDGLLPSQFVCTWKEGGSGAAWVHAAGELDVATSSRLGQTLQDAGHHASLVVLDLREVTFVDTSGIHAILDAAAGVRRTGGHLVLVRGGPHVDRVLALTGASDHVAIFDLDTAQDPSEVLLHLAQLYPGG